MKRRITVWAAVGVVVASCWALYFVRASKDNPIGPMLYTLTRLTCPVVFAGDYFHFGIKLYWVLLANAVMYALVGLIVETLRHQPHHAK